MKRRHMLLTALAWPWVQPASAANPNWAYRILDGGRTGTVKSFGLELTLADGWKTYWRVPGAGGIPPSIAVMGDQVENVRVSHPAPTRFSDLSGETIGYEKRVVFPIDVTLAENASSAKLSVFLGVCREVCIPVSIEEPLDMASAGAHAAELASWHAKVPKLTQDNFPVVSVSEARLGVGLSIALAAPVDDILIEVLERPHFYCHAPVINGNIAAIDVAGNVKGESLKGLALRVTSLTQTVALEQELTVV